MEEYRINLGLDEFIVAVSLFNKPEEAKRLLISSLGQISPDEEKGRLSAAYNSLYARNLITFEADKAKLSPELLALLEIFFQSNKSIRAGKSMHYGEDVVAYYAHENEANNWLEHSIDQRIAHHFKYPVSVPTVQHHLSDFFSPLTSTNLSMISLDIPQDIFVNGQLGVGHSDDEILSVLSKNSTPTEAIRLFAEDWAHSSWRGSTTWMVSKDNEQIATRGYLWLQGNQRLWSITSSGNEQNRLWKATLVSPDEFNSRLSELINTQMQNHSG